MENGRRNVFMTKSQWKNVPEVGIELGGRLHAKQTRFRSSYRARSTAQSWYGDYNTYISIFQLLNFLEFGRQIAANCEVINCKSNSEVINLKSNCEVINCKSTDDMGYQ